MDYIVGRGHIPAQFVKKECHCEERSDVAIRTPNDFIQTSDESKHFGERIATPVCALARNDVFF